MTDLPIMCPAIQGDVEIVRLHLCGILMCFKPTYGRTAWCKEHLDELQTPSAEELQG